MKKFSLALLGLIVSIVAVSQENYLAGYIITNAKDTVRGYIDYRNWKVNPKAISFKRNLDAETMIYPPTHIAAFQSVTSFMKLQLLISKLALIK